MTVEIRANSQASGIRNLILGDEAWAQGCECIKGFSTTPLRATPFDLPIASADIVGAGVAKDMVQGILFPDIFSSFAKNHRQLALIIYFVATQAAGKDDGVIGVLDRGTRFYKENRMGGQGDMTFLSVLSII